MSVPPYLLVGLELTPKALSAIVLKVPESKYDQAPSEGRFTLRESVAHVLDWETIFRDRIRLAVQSSGATIEQFDEDRMPIEKRYHEWDVQDSLIRFREERATTVEAMRSLSPEECHRIVLHPKHGVLSVPDIGWMLLMHDIYHLEHATLFL